MRNRGFTLIEMLISSVMLTAVLGVMYGLWSALGDTAGLLHAKASAHEDAVRATLRTARELRGAARTTLSQMPANELTYQVAVDFDGNGFAVDREGRIELGPPRRIARDTGDANEDGLAGDQLVLLSENGVEVLASGLYEDEDANGNGKLDPGEDKNRNERLDRGVWFENVGNTVRICVQTMRTERKGFLIVGESEQYVSPRN